MTAKDFGWILARSFVSKATSDSEIPNNFFVFEDNGGKRTLGMDRSVHLEAATNKNLNVINRG